MATPATVIDVDGQSVRISNPDKVYFPSLGVTKMDVVQYFLAVGPGICSALHHRPTTLERWPGGYQDGFRLTTRMGDKGEAFYQKRIPKTAPEWVPSAQVTFPSGRTADEVCPDSLAVVAWAANLGTLRFHPWPVTAAQPDQPDQLRIDLDPQPGTDFHDCAKVGLVVRETLAKYGLSAMPKTSGGRGLHIFAPIAPKWSFVEVRRAVIVIGREVAAALPGEVTMDWWKEERGERVFIDFNQAARDRTMASAYSLRPNSRATASAPLQWDEVMDVMPEDFDIRTLPKRFAQIGDPWAVQPPAGDLSALLDKAARDLHDHQMGDLPYPPEYPKMPGEPPRVAPSKRNPANW
ncbi:MAG: ATP-dependent DNA ligase [Antricoccus sp.]